MYQRSNIDRIHRTRLWHPRPWLSSRSWEAAVLVHEAGAKKEGYSTIFNDIQRYSTAACQLFQHHSHDSHVYSHFFWRNMFRPRNRRSPNYGRLSLNELFDEGTRQSRKIDVVGVDSLLKPTIQAEVFILLKQMEHWAQDPQTVQDVQSA